MFLKSFIKAFSYLMMMNLSLYFFSKRCDFSIRQLALFTKLNQVRGGCPYANVGNPYFIAFLNASIPPTIGKSIVVEFKSTVSSVPGIGQSVYSLSLENIMRPIC